MRYARLTATLAICLLFGALTTVLNRNPSESATQTIAAHPNINLYKAFNWQSEAAKVRAVKARQIQEEALAKAAAEKAAADAKAAADRAAAAQKVARTRSTPRAVVRGDNNGDFASCVRQRESTNNYAYNDGQYHGAYNMTTSHWGGYGGYSRPEDAPPSVQDEKFRSDVAQGSGYMHQQYPQTSRACGM